jgi:hypothetical protein
MFLGSRHRDIPGAGPAVGIDSLHGAPFLDSLGVSRASIWTSSSALAEFRALQRNRSKIDRRPRYGFTKNATQKPRAMTAIMMKFRGDTSNEVSDRIRPKARALADQGESQGTNERLRGPIPSQRLIAAEVHCKAVNISRIFSINLSEIHPDSSDTIHKHGLGSVGGGRKRTQQ